MHAPRHRSITPASALIVAFLVIPGPAVAIIGLSGTRSASTFHADGRVVMPSSTPAARTVSTRAAAAHATITEYTGPETCVACHQQEAEDAFHSVHYQQSGPTPNVPNIDGNAGKLDKGFNTYCGTPLSSPPYACATCHVSYGGYPSGDMTQAQLNNIDCLMCHQEQYNRKWAGPFEEHTYTDYLGVTRSWQLPVVNAAGDFSLMPDEANMPISIVEAAQTVHLPTRTTCLRCHAYAAGSNCGKRGDLSTVLEDPPITSDYHMSAAGANLVCQDCHETENHRVLGRGLDLRPNDRPERLTCSNCHSEQPHDGSELDAHTGHVACQACHIPTYAKVITTEMERDWRVPVWSQGLLGGQGGFKPEETRDSQVVPTYEWYDGTSDVYAIGQVAAQNDAGEYEFGDPHGNVRGRAAKIHPMKEHRSVSARHDATGQIAPHATFKFFVTGDFDQAVADGMAYAGLSGSYTLVDVHTYQTINHGVEIEENALACGQCHSSMSGGPARMNLQTDLGYELKGPRSQVCFQCHGQEENKPFRTIHEKHVKDKNFDCSWCHNFTRPERNLTPAPDVIAGDANCDRWLDELDVAAFRLALLDPAAYATAYPDCDIDTLDLNGDGFLDGRDIQLFVALQVGP